MRYVKYIGPQVRAPLPAETVLFGLRALEKDGAYQFDGGDVQPRHPASGANMMYGWHRMDPDHFQDV